MIIKSNKVQWLLVVLLIGTFIPAAQAKSKKRNKRRGQLVHSIREAMDRSNKDHKKMKVKIDFSNEQLMESWDERDTASITIDNSKVNLVDRVNLGRPDFSLEEPGEDHSGLDSLKNNIDIEEEFIDFDKELREVSSIGK